jgi:hypothetical protein
LLLCRSLDEAVVFETSLRLLPARPRGDSHHTAYYTDHAMSDTVENSIANRLSRARVLL